MIRAALILVSCVAVEGAAVAQPAAHLKKLESNTTWEYYTTAGLSSIKGEFAGIVDDWFLVRDADGIKHYIPIDALVDEDRDLFFALRGTLPQLGMPGATARRASNPDFTEYAARMDGRRTEALYERRKTLPERKYNYRTWTAIAKPYNPLFAPFDRSMIEFGIVRQPRLPVVYRRPYPLYGRSFYRSRGPVFLVR